MTKFAPWFLLLTLFNLSAFAQNNVTTAHKFFAGKHVKFTHPNPHTFKIHGNLPTPHGFPANVDTLTNFTGHFQAPGLYPVSATAGFEHNIWEYSMVGNPPDKGGTTLVNAPVVPVTMDLRNSDDSTGVVLSPSNCLGCTKAQLGQTVRLISKPDNFIQPFMNGPEFGVSDYSSSSVPTQVIDAEQKAEFGNHARADWHTLLQPGLKTARTMVIDQSTDPTKPNYVFALNGDGSCCLFILVDSGVFGNKLFPPTAPPDNSTVIGAAEVAGDITTKDVSTFFFPNVYLYDNGNINNCCVLGFHTFDLEPGDAKNGNLPKFYVVNYSSWITPGLFDDPSTCAPDNCFEDVTAHSHEVAEIFNDPFVAFDGIHNATPFWLSGNVSSGNFQCQDVMEVGDVLEVLSNPTVPVTINGFTYHPQTIALLPWFEFQGNSSAINNAYSYPNETALTSLSAPQQVNCGLQ